MDFFEAVLLGFVQGVTEWLPVSSSGHLALMQLAFGLNVPVLFDIMLHVGTAFAVVVVFRRDIALILKSAARLDFKGGHGKTALYIAAASLPTAVVGFAFKDLFESLFYRAGAVGLALMATGFFLFTVGRAGGMKKIGLKEALSVGFMQGLAIVPGLSRSGLTIGIALLLGVEKENASRFSILLALPAITGAAVFDFNGVELSSIGLSAALGGVLVSFAVGVASIRLLLSAVRKQKLHWFGFYCCLLGVITILYSGFGF